MNSLSPNVRVLQELHAHTSDVTSVEFYGSSLLLTGSSDKSVRFFKWKAGVGFQEDEKCSPMLGHKYSVTKSCFSPKGGVIASASVDGTIILWDLSTGQKTGYLYQANGESIRNCIFSPNGNQIVGSDDSGSVCVFNQDKLLKKTLKFHEESVHIIAFSPDSNIFLSGCTSGNIRLFKVHDFDDDKIEPDCLIDCAHDMGIFAAEFTKLTRTDPMDSNTSIYTLATGGTDHLIKIWRIFCLTECPKTEASSSKKPDRAGRSTFQGSRRLIPLSPQEHLSGSSTIYCTKKMNAECTLTIAAHASSVTCVKFNQAGTILASSSLDKTVKLWDMQGNCLKTLIHHERYVNCVAFNSDGTILASGSNDQKVIIWDLKGNCSLDTHLSNGIRSLMMLTNQSDKVSDHWFCPITHDLMKFPVLLEDGFTYERSAIEAWFARGKSTSPMTNAELNSKELLDNFEVKGQIDKYLKALDFDPFD